MTIKEYMSVIAVGVSIALVVVAIKTINQLKLPNNFG